MLIAIYLAVIVAANIITAKISPIPIGYLIIPAGSFLIGTMFIIRDLLQRKYGRETAYIAIIVGLILSAISAVVLGDSLAIVIASSVAFALSETTDTEIYTRLRLPFTWRVFYSGSVGGIIDSAAFAIIGLSPIGAGFLTWEEIPLAIAGQVVAKFSTQWLGVIGIAIVGRWRKIGR